MGYIEKLDSLKQSLIFNLSLSSKELFHSNFIGWLFGNYPKIMKDFLNNNEDDYENLEIERESNNYDIMILSKKSCYIIENKVKSLPDENQLKEYCSSAEKIKRDKKYFYLLSLNEPLFDLAEPWKYKSYKNLIDIIRANLPESNSYPGAYHRAILIDYCDFIDILSNLNNEYFTPKRADLLFDNKDILNKIRELRIYDLYYKIRYEYVVRFLNEDISKLDRKITLEKPWEKLDNNEILIKHDLMRSTGLIEAKIAFDIKNELLVLGVQIHDNQFRLFVQSTNRKLIEKLIQNNSFVQLWFNFSLFEEYYPQAEEKQKKVFCGYETSQYNMKYRYKSFSELKISALLKIFVLYIEYAFSIRGEIENLVF